MRPVRLALTVTFAAQTLLACGGGKGGAAAPPPTGSPRPPLPPSASVEPWHGHFVGTATIGGEPFFVDALLTKDGMIRLYVGSEGQSSGLFDSARPPSSIQFAGEFDVANRELNGSGGVLGQACSFAEHSNFCDEPATGVIRLNFDPTNRDAGLSGDLRIATDAGVETWQLSLFDWSFYYASGAVTSGLAGQWTELVAEFAGDGETVVTIDGLGRMFFQSPTSGCTGNGVVTPHLDGNYHVFDIELRISNCGAQYLHLNGDFSGLATTSTSSYWDYDAALRAWLSKSAVGGPPAAVTMWGPYIY